MHGHGPLGRIGAGSRRKLMADKKIIGGKLFFVLPKKIGKVIITDDVEAEFIVKVLE